MLHAFLISKQLNILGGLHCRSPGFFVQFSPFLYSVLLTLVTLLCPNSQLHLLHLGNVTGCLGSHCLHHDLEFPKDLSWSNCRGPSFVVHLSQSMFQCIGNCCFIYFAHFFLNLTVEWIQSPSYLIVQELTSSGITFLSEKTRANLWFFRNGCLADIFSRINKVIL